MATVLAGAMYDRVMRWQHQKGGDCMRPRLLPVHVPDCRCAVGVWHGAGGAAVAEDQHEVPKDHQGAQKSGWKRFKTGWSQRFKCCWCLSSWGLKRKSWGHE